MSLKISEDIANIDMHDIGDNILYYKYNIKHLVKLEKLKVDKESPEFLSAYRSFAGLVYENYLYEKLLIYAKNNPELGNFILKGPHALKKNSLSNSLHVDMGGQIVYKTKAIEIGEFDALFFNENEIIFVEMTLIKSVKNLKRRLRKKKALLETLFPKHTIKALIILTKGVIGSTMMPDYCTVWLTNQFEVDNIYTHLKSDKFYKKKPFIKRTAPNLVSDAKLKTFPFKYYNSLSWILRKLRAKQDNILDIEFLKTKSCTRYINLFTKIYIGYIDKEEFQGIYPDISNITEKVAVAVEKEHTGRLTVIYFMQYSRKNLVNITFKNGKAKIVKKDSHGISVTEVFHILHKIEKRYRLNENDLNEIDKILRHWNMNL